MNEPKYGDVRIYKLDKLNWVVQTYRERTKKDGEVEGIWETTGHYGHHLDWAFVKAITLGFPKSEVLKVGAILEKTIKDLYAQLELEPPTTIFPKATEAVFKDTKKPKRKTRTKKKNEKN